MGIELQIEPHGIEGLREALGRLSELETRELLEGIGAEVESQTKLRITEEKRGPDGTPWPRWSPRYVQTRHSGHSLLRSDGHLLDSIASAVSGDQVAVGTNLIYARIHQLGGQGTRNAGLPARPYLGVSEENAADLEELVAGYLRRLAA